MSVATERLSLWAESGSGGQVLTRCEASLTTHRNRPRKSHTHLRDIAFEGRKI
jgi:hypothetical protein